MSAGCARSALSKRVPRVQREDHPADALAALPAGEATHAAVFHGEAFCGILDLREVLFSSPKCIFADLLASTAPSEIPETMPLQAVAESMRALHLTAVPVVDPENRFVGVVTETSLLAALVSHHRNSLKESARLANVMEQEAARTRAILETAVDCIVTIDEEGIIESFNPAGERMFGYRAEEVLGNNISMLMPAPHAEKHDGYICHYLETGEAKIIGVGRVAEALRKDGSVFPVELAISEVHVGGRRSFTGVVRDITEQERVKSEFARLSRFPLENPNPVLELRSDGVVTYANPAAQALGARLGLAPDRLGHMFPGDPGHLVEQCLAEMRDLIGCEVRLKDRVLTWALHPVPGRKLVHAYGQDITERQRIQEELRTKSEHLERMNRELEEQSVALAEQANELSGLCDAAQRADRAKSEFLANMSHEIRTPMTAILGFTDVLLEQDATESDKLNAVNTVRRNGEHLLSLINDILDISKLESGKLDVERITCTTSTILGDVCDLLAGRADDRGVQLKLEVSGLIPESFQTDPTRLRQALLNLVGNAIKFSRNGTIRIVVSCQRAVELIQFQVIDQGIGMTPEQIGRLFQPFVQADASMTRRFGGTGLGLTITKRIAGILGGDCVVTSAAGVGSTFTLTVATGSLDGVTMVSTAQPPKPKRPVSATEPGEMPTLTGRVLLVEDGPDNQRLISRILMRAGASVTVASNGKEGVDQAIGAMRHRRANDPDEPYDLILMDMQMPVMDGYEATRVIRGAGYDGQIIAITAHAMKGEADKCLAAGCDHHMPKPIDRATLLREVYKRMRLRSSGCSLVSDVGNAGLLTVVRSAGVE